MGCDHSTLQSGGARFLPNAGKLQLLLICDQCGAERARLGQVDYRPDPRLVVVQVAEQIAHELGLGAATTERVRFAALVCDRPSRRRCRVGLAAAVATHHARRPPGTGG